jgi:hypothetical protein
MPTTVNGYKSLVIRNYNIASGLEQIAGVGFYKIGQSLLKAKQELKDDFGELKKSLAVEGLHIKQQERYMMVARNPIIIKHFSKMPPEWTFWMKLSQLHDQSVRKGQIDKFDKLIPLISPDAKWRDIEDTWYGGKQPIKRSKKDRRETHYITVNSLKLRKGDKKDVLQFEKDLAKLLKKYKFATVHKTKKKDDTYYYDEVVDFVSANKLADDTISTTTKTNRPRYSNKKRSL